MTYSSLAPGKRLRPLLCLLACEACSGTLDEALPAACALEMVHAYSLIHDDLPAMDDDDLRRGMPTCHKQFDEATAILAGDALLTLTFETVAEHYPPSIAAVSCLELAKGAGAAGMVAGQMLDLEAESTGEPASLERLEAIHTRKTGALFRSAVRLGLYVAEAGRPQGLNKAHLSNLDAYAANFGLAFQVTDDLLDVESTVEATGKRVGKDAVRGKLTYPGLLGIPASRAKANDLVNRAVEAAESFGERGRLLADLAKFVLERNT